MPNKSVKTISTSQSRNGQGADFRIDGFSAEDITLKRSGPLDLCIFMKRDLNIRKKCYSMPVNQPMSAMSCSSSFCRWTRQKNEESNLAIFAHQQKIHEENRQVNFGDYESQSQGHRSNPLHYPSLNLLNNRICRKYFSPRSRFLFGNQILAFWVTISGDPSYLFIVVLPLFIMINNGSTTIRIASINRQKGLR